MRSKCGKRKSNSGKPFTESSVKQHEKDCKKCNSPDDASMDHAATSIINDGAFLEISRTNPYI